MEKAKEAKDANDASNELEAIKLSVVESISMGDNGLVSLSNLKNALLKIPNVISTEETNALTGNGPWDVTGKITGKKYSITGSGEVIELEGGPTIVGTIQRWEPVNYKPEKLSITNNDLPEGTSLNNNVTADQIEDWVVLNYDETTGDVLIVPTYKSTKNIYASLKLDRMLGYNNSIQALDAIAGIYKNPQYAKSSKSIRVEDINNITRYEPTGTQVNKSWVHRYGMDEKMDIVDYGDSAERQYKATPENLDYLYGTSNDIYYNLGVNQIWLASRCLNIRDDSCIFIVRTLEGMNVATYADLFYAWNNGTIYQHDVSHNVFPVVSLKSGVTMQKDENGVWQLSV